MTILKPLKLEPAIVHKKMPYSGIINLASRHSALGRGIDTNGKAQWSRVFRIGMLMVKFHGESNVLNLLDGGKSNNLFYSSKGFSRKRANTRAIKWL